MIRRISVVASVLVLGVLAEAAVERGPLLVKPRSENSSVDLWNTEVGSQGWLKFELPDNVADYKEAILLLHVDDIDAPEEAELIVNEKLALTWPKSIIGEGEHGGAIPFDVKVLHPGRNYFQFVFKSNLNNTTAGCAIRAAELQLFTSLSARQKERILLEAASWGKPVDWTKEDVREGPPSPTPRREEPAITDRFQNDPLARWDALAGDWSVTNDIDIFDLEQRDIYRSPEEPGHLAWVGLWKQTDSSIRSCFAQITGNVALEPSYRPWYGRGKSFESWQQFCKDHGMRLGPEDAIPTTKVEYLTLLSRDNGDTWENLGPGLKPVSPNLRVVYAADGSLVDTDGIATILCRDGRLVSTPNPKKWRLGGKSVHEQFLLAIAESTDNGKTWSSLQWIKPEGIDPVLLKETSNENAMVELDDGRILMVVRCDPGGPCQTYLTRVAPGKYEATPPTRLPMPHSGLPELVRGSDGVIWRWGIDGHWYTEDDGATWRRAPFRFTSYYGKMLEAAPNRMLCLTQYSIGDSPYPHWYDASIRMVRFSWRRSGALQQNNADRPVALLTRHAPTLNNLHLRADIRIDGANGLAFRVRPDGKSFYALAIVLPGSPVYARYFPPEIQAEVVAANYTAADNVTTATGEPMLVIARIENKKITVLRGMRLKYIPKRSWVRLQVKVTGDLIQGAVNTDPPTYVGARDGAFTSGGVAFLTDTSTGAFKNLHLWSSPQMIRQNWK